MVVCILAHGTLRRKKINFIVQVTAEKVPDISNV